VVEPYKLEKGFFMSVNVTDVMVTIKEIESAAEEMKREAECQIQKAEGMLVAAQCLRDEICKKG
jgi:hypothetical protein